MASKNSCLRGLRGERSGFTLIEILVVIAIIGILAGITLVGYGAIMRDIRIRKARGECAILLAACKTYHALLHEWPDSVESDRELEILTILSSPIETPDLGRPAVLESLKESQTDDQGRMIDPWGNPYAIEFPEDQVLVYSFGPDMDSDEAHFDGDGCADGAHDAMGLGKPVDDVRP